MYIVNTSFMVEPSVHDRWLKFVTEKYIPALRARGFGKVVFTRRAVWSMRRIISLIRFR